MKGDEMFDIEAEALKWASVYDMPIEIGVEGAYDGERHAIYLSQRLSPVQRRWVLAHEVSHARHNDGRCHASLRDQMERRADMEASRMLINPVDYASAEQINDDTVWLAHELDVMPQTIISYRDWLHESMQVLSD
jgi:Zn-dependent peptidase ImmA (M78 family)